MSEFITELLKKKMIPFGVINGRRKDLSKYNPYHDELGRFSSGSGSSKKVGAGGLLFHISAKENRKSIEQNGLTGNSGKPVFFSEQPHVFDITDTDVYVVDTSGIKLSPDTKRLIDRARKSYSSETAIPSSKIRRLTGAELKAVYETHNSYNWNPDVIEKANPYHDEIGRFTFAPDGARTSVPKKPKVKRKASVKSKVKLDDVHHEDLDAKAEKVHEQAVKKLKNRGIKDSAVAVVLASDQIDSDEELKDLTQLDFTSDGGDLKPEFLKSMYEVKVGDYSSTVTAVHWSGNQEKTQGTITIEGVVNKKGLRDAVGSFERGITISSTSLNDGGLISGAESVSHNVFTMLPEHQGSGFGAVFFANSISHYKELGATYVTTHANIDIGGYAWAKAGFEFSGDPTEYTHDLAVDVNKAAVNFARAEHGMDSVTSTIEKSLRIQKYEIGQLSPTNLKRYNLAMKKAEASIAKNKTAFEKIEQDFADYDMPASQNYQPIDFANIGIKQAVEVLMPVRKVSPTSVDTSTEYELQPIKVWIGKLIMLGSDWEGELYIGE